MQIRYNLHKLENALVFQVTEQSAALTKYLQGKGKFVASNGWTLISYDYPGIDIESKTLSLRGMSEYLSLKPDYVFGLANSERDALAVNLVTAIGELLDASIGEDNHIEYPTFSKSTFRSDSHVEIITL